MTSFVDVPISTFFEAKNGQARFVRDYMEQNAGPYPVYSASLAGPFGYVNDFRYDGRYLTWVMNGYGGRVEEVEGRFSATRDRGVFVPVHGKLTPDLTYVRYVLEPLLMAAAVGRRVDGRANDYTKIYPTIAEAISIPVPVDGDGGYDYEAMQLLGSRYRQIENAQSKIAAVRDSLAKATFALPDEAGFQSVSLGAKDVFKLEIGERVLLIDHVEHGVPTYSANALSPFASIAESNLHDFTRPSILWGIDGNFDINFIKAGEIFATTDHCGRLQIEDEDVDPDYVFQYIRATRGRYGFDRVYRASLTNMRADLTVAIPTDPATGAFDLNRQKAIAAKVRGEAAAKENAIALIAEVARTRMAAA